MKPLIIRADANGEIGSGHVMRCLALAEAWHASREEPVIFIFAMISPSLEARIKREGFEIIHIETKPGSDSDAQETSRIAQMNGAGWIVVDGYQFSGIYQKTIKKLGHSLLVIDDYGHAEHYYADIVLNQNIYANPTLYPSHEAETRFLLGTKYVLLRKEFLHFKNITRVVPEIGNKILVTLGGSDPDNITGIVVNSLKLVKIKGLEVIIVVGGLNTHLSQLEDTIKDHPNFSIHQNAENMPELMEWADFAISAGGTTCWELAFMGVPAILIPVAENQKNTLHFFEVNRMAKIMQISAIQNDLYPTINNLLQSMKERDYYSNAIKMLVDGKGTLRIIHAIASYNFKLRLVKESDCLTVWKWINDIEVRNQSFNPDKISLAEHEKWFKSALNDPHLVYYIATDDQDHPIGQSRFLIEGREATISILLEPDFRGLNLGARLITKSTDRLFAETHVETVNAYIKRGNQSSLRSFKNAGYHSSGVAEIKKQTAYHLSKKRVFI